MSFSTLDPMNGRNDLMNAIEGRKKPLEVTSSVSSRGSRRLCSIVIVLQRLFTVGLQPINGGGDSGFLCETNMLNPTGYVLVAPPWYTENIAN